MAKKKAPRKWMFRIDPPGNRRSKQVIVSVLDDKGHTLVTDRADLTSIQDRQKVAKRLAARLRKRKLSAADLEAKLEAAWTAHIDAQRQQAEQEGAEEKTVLDRIQDVLETDGAAALYADEQLLNELADLAVNNRAGYAAAREMVRKRKGSVQDLDKTLRPLVDALCQARHSHDSGDELASPYRETPVGITWLRRINDTEVSVPLTNFTARIVAGVALDDGAEVRRRFEIETWLKGWSHRFLVPSERFAAMNWPVEHLGARAIVYPGQSLKDHTRCAVQLLSGEPPRRTVFAHLGWRLVEGDWLYLHAGGAVGRVGRVDGIEMDLPPSLAHYTLPDPPTGEALKVAVRASLRLLKLAKDRLAYPLAAAVARAVLDAADFSIFVTGPTHEGKTELTSRYQQHWGPAMDARRMPANWLSTGNALEGLAFAAKDAILTVDDFVPGGGHTDVARLHREAERLLRAQGNRSGRLRMSADATLRREKYPRGLIVATGEDVPRGQSLRGRNLILEVGPGDVDWSLMSACQKDGADGLYAQALSGFLRWLAPRYDGIPKWLTERAKQLRDQAADSGMHRRTPFIVAHLYAGWELWVQYAVESGAVSEAEAEALKGECWQALGVAAAAQAKYQAAAEPARRFLELLAAAITSGRAHVAGVDGTRPPETPEAWGWRSPSVGTGGYARDEWRPQGELVAWIDDTGLYVDAEAAFAVVQVLGRDGGEVLTVGLPTLKRRLNEKRLLTATDAKRETLTVRKTLGGRRRDVLCFSADVLTIYTSENPTNPTTAPSNGTAGRVGGQVLVGSEEEIRPREPVDEEEVTPDWSGWSGRRPVDGDPGRNGAAHWSGSPETPDQHPASTRPNGPEGEGVRQGDDDNDGHADSWEGP
jgi:hypothetical protein